MTAIVALWAAVAAACAWVAHDVGIRGGAAAVSVTCIAVWVCANAVLVLASMAAGPPTGGLVAVAAPLRLEKTPGGTRSAVAKAVLAPWRWLSRAIATAPVMNALAAAESRRAPPAPQPAPWSCIPATFVMVGQLQAAPHWFAVTHGAGKQDVVLDLTAEWEWASEWVWSSRTSAATARPTVHCIPLLDDCMCSAAHLAAKLSAALGNLAMRRRMVVSAWPPSRVYVGCMFGVGRSAAVGALLAAVLHPETYATVDAALAALKTVRPQVGPTALQMRVVRETLHLLRAQ
jgi:hypothetical protein